MDAPITSPVQAVYSRDVLADRIQRERDQAIQGEWNQIDRILRILATTCDAIAVRLGEAREKIIYDRSSAIEIVDEQRHNVVEVATQLRTARVNPDRNEERKASEAKR